MSMARIMSKVFSAGPMIMIPAAHVTRHAHPPYASWAGGIMARPMALMRKRLVFGGAWDQAATPCADMLSFRRVYSLAEHLPDYRASLWYEAARRSFEKHGYFRHKTTFARSVAEIDHLFEADLVPLVSSMRDQGYRQRPNSDVPLALIGRNGEILKTEKGRHRFAAAQAVGCSAFPLRIAAIHSEWVRSQGLSPFQARRSCIEQAVRQLEQSYQKGPLL